MTDYKIPSAFPHPFYRLSHWADYEQDRTELEVPADHAIDAHVVSSRIRGTSRHTVMLDLDVPAALIPSSTPGHGHLYIDVPMPWWKYRVLLKVLAWVGVIEPGYYGASVMRKATYLRCPWVKKDTRRERASL